MKIKSLVLFVLLTITTFLSAIAQHPDAVYPIPDNYNSKYYQGINLFTGDLNLPIDLVTVQGTDVSYSLKALYNSRSMYLNQQVAESVHTVLGGNGWKLMDYPKIVAANETYYLVNGLRSFPLTKTEAKGNTTLYSAGSFYHLWKITRTGTSPDTYTWTLTTEEGTTYQYNEPAVTQQNVSIWNFNRIIAAQGVDTLFFSYAGNGDLTYIKNQRGDTYNLKYAQINNKIYLDNITHLRNGRVHKEIDLSYTSHSVYGKTLHLLSSIENKKAIAPMNLFGITGASTHFSYTNTALEQWAGTYTTDTKYGGKSGTWHSAPSVTITADGQVKYGSTRINNPQFTQNKLSWSADDGNPNNARFTLKFGDTGSYFWGDKTIKTNCFTGWLQSGSEGKIDFRGRTDKKTPNAGALTKVIKPRGSISTYQYEAYNLNGTKALPIVEHTIDNGYDNISGDKVNTKVYSVIQYDTSNVQTELSSSYIHYNSTDVFPGGKYSGEHAEKQPYGGYAYYFFNGNLPPTLKHLPSDYDASVPTNPAVLGFVYHSETNGNSLAYNDKQQKRTSSDCYWQVVQDNANENVLYPRLHRQYTERYGVGNWTTYQYNDEGLRSAKLTSRENPQVSSKSGFQQDSVQYRYTYAYEQYPALSASGLNILTPIVQQTELVQHLDAAGWDTVSSNYTQWTQWGESGLPEAASGYWAKWKKFKLNSNSAPKSPAQKTNPIHWRKSSEVLKRSAQYQVAGRMDEDSTAQYTTYVNPRMGNLPLAIFNSANPFKNEAFYLGFESYEDTGSSEYQDDNTTSVFAHTGIRSLKTSSFNKQAITPDNDKELILAGWILTTDHNDVDLSIKIDSKTVVQQNILATGGRWKYIEQPISAPVAGSSISFKLDSDSPFYLDDLRYSPRSKPFTANVYDGASRTKIASIGANGATMHTAYSAFDNAIVTAGPDTNRAVRSLALSYNSRKGHSIFADSSTFSTENPNMTITGTVRTDGDWEGFELAASSYFPKKNLTNMSIQSGLLVSEGTPENEANATFNETVASNNYLVSAEFIPNKLQKGQELGLSITHKDGTSSNEVRFVLTSEAFKLYNADSQTEYHSHPIKNIPDHTFISVEIVDGNHLFAYAGSRFLFEQKFNGTLSGHPKIISSNTYSYTDNFIVAINPILTKTTYDALNREKQKLIRIRPNELRVEEKLYGGALNLHSATTKSTVVKSSDVGRQVGSGIPMSFIPNFAIYDASNLTVDSTSIVSKAYGYDNPYTHSKEYTHNPLRKTESTGSGGDFAANKNGTDYFYGSNNQDSLGYRSNTLLTKTVQNPDDLKGLSVASLKGYQFSEFNHAEGDTITWQYSFDQNMRPSRKFQPNYFPDGLNNPNFYTMSGYNFIGNQTSYRKPDSGTEHRIYNPEGKIWFKIDSTGLQSMPNKIRYWKYDHQGRKVEIGYLEHSWNPETLQQYANQNSQPDWPYVWQKRFNYGDSFTAAGRLKNIFTNNDSDTTAEVKETLKYDLTGNIISKNLTVFDFDTTARKVSYEYDLMGNVTQIKTHSGAAITYTYDNLGYIESIGTPDNPDYYASYTYKDTILVETLNNDSFQRTYDLNAAGWIDKIKDPLFTETLTYTKGGIEDEGYYSGLIASSSSAFNWDSAPENFTYKYKYDPFGRLTAGYLPETDQNDINYITYDDNGNITTLQRWEDKNIYWNDYSSGNNWLVRANVTSPNDTSRIFNGGEYPDAFYGFAIDSDKQKIYWAGKRNHSIMRAGLDGSNDQTVHALSHDPSGLAIDGTHRNLYWSEPFNRAIARIGLDDNNQDYLFTNYGKPVNVALDPHENKLYWPDVSSSPNTIKSANLEGGDIQTVLTLPEESEIISGFAIDTLRDQLYWSGSTTIQYAAQDGSGDITTLYSGGSNIQQLSLDIFNKKVFWSDDDINKIQSIKFDGNSVSTFSGGLDNPEWITQNMKSNMYSYKKGTNQLTGTEGTTDRFAYDGNGNVVKSKLDQIDSLTYLPYIQHTSKILKNDRSITFQYNGANQRVLKSNGQTSRFYLHGTSRNPVEIYSRGSGETSTTTYIYGPTGLISARHNGTDYFILKDHLASTRVVTNTDNNVVSHLNYTPFGKLMEDASDTTASLPVVYRFTGQEYDAETGLYNYKARMYAPEVGRFYSVDPGQQFASSYVYVGNNPVLYTDPSGMFFSEIFKGTVKGAFYGGMAGGTFGAGASVIVGPEAILIGAGAGGAVGAAGGFVYGVGEGIYNLFGGSSQTSTQIKPINRFDWTKKGLAGDRTKYVNGQEINGWKYDDKYRDELNMNSENLDWVTELTSGAISQLENGRYIYVYRGYDNKFLMRKYDRGTNFARYRYSENYRNGEYLHVRHSQLNGGWKPLWCAGELSIKDHKIYRINNESGHFKPQEWRVNHFVVPTLKKWGIPFHNDAKWGDFKYAPASEY